ncbi:hypothetical protein [Pedobacter sp. L105]|uniref:hypothetical protein n=1 Tax=Pedobacter sp. L105 TaxID=1641871 RepID=UPI00131C8C97|nr:hypothetical protein [Pedobacter sp. L105]
MEFQKIKPRRTVCFRSKQVIMELLEKYESLKGKTSPTEFCKGHGVPVGTFYTWLRYRREGKYKAEGRFIAISVEPVVAEASRPIPIFASISSGELTVQLHEFVSPDYILSLFNKRQGS